MVRNQYPFGIQPLNLYGSSKKESERDGRRNFSQTQRKEILYQQDNRCARTECHKRLDPRDIHYHHEKPWASGGRTITTNGRAVCGSCHNILGHEENLKRVDKKRPHKSNNYLGLPEFKPYKFKPAKTFKDLF